MARIVFGLGTSHGPLLSTPPDQWHLRAAADRKNPEHPYRGGTYSFDELVARREGDDLARQIAPEVRAERYERCQAALARLGESIAAARPDIVVIVGNDQRELFLEELNPAFTIFHGEAIENPALDAAEAAHMDPGIVVSMWANKPPEDAVYPGVPRLADHIVEGVMESGFDVAVSKVLPKGGGRREGIPHAYGFFYRRILGDKPIPAVPVILNTFYPPNQPSAARCYAFGEAIAAAIRAWDSEARIGVVASGGLSHFVVDEDFDRRILAAMQANDPAGLTSEPAAMFRSGTSETKNWITALGILKGSGLAMELVDYVPCYRSEAGTGSGMAFATWQ